MLVGILKINISKPLAVLINNYVNLEVDAVILKTIQTVPRTPQFDLLNSITQASRCNSLVFLLH